MFKKDGKYLLFLQVYWYEFGQWIKMLSRDDSVSFFTVYVVFFFPSKPIDLSLLSIVKLQAGCGIIESNKGNKTIWGSICVLTYTVT